jgi:hypothetical protein
MRKIVYIFLWGLLFLACETPDEYGAPEIEILSRKLFDSLKSDKFDRSRLLMPDKGTFRKLQDLDNTPEAEIEYDMFIADAQKKYQVAKSSLLKWQDATYQHTTYEVSKSEPRLLAIVVTKFIVNDRYYKLIFTAQKYNNRWYYLGDMQSLARTNSLAHSDPFNNIFCVLPFHYQQFHVYSFILN